MSPKLRAEATVILAEILAPGRVRSIANPPRSGISEPLPVSGVARLKIMINTTDPYLSLALSPICFANATHKFSLRQNNAVAWQPLAEMHEYDMQI